MERGARSSGPPRIALPILIAVAVVLAGVGAAVYLIATAPSPTGDGIRPTVVLSGPQEDVSVVDILVLEASPVYSLGDYRARLLVDNVSAGELDPLVDGGSDGLVAFSDVDANGTLSQGDRFTVQRRQVGFFLLFVYWRDEQVGVQGWQESPSIVLGPESPTPSGYTVDVAVAPDARPLAEFAARLMRDVGTYGRIGALADGARDRNLSFADLDGRGTLTTGDRFAIDIAEPGEYALVVTWRGIEVARRNWTVSLPGGGPTITLCCLGGSYMTAFGVTVESADPVVPTEQYRAVLLQNGTLYKDLDPLQTGGGNGSFRFFDGNSIGNLDGGDRFAFDCSPEEELMGWCPGKLPVGFHYEFRLYWGAVLVAILAFDH